MDMMWRSTLSSLLTMESVKPNWLNFIPQTSPKTHYLPRYLIPQFLLERIMVNVLLYRCCAAKINSCRKLGHGAVMRPSIERSIESERSQNAIKYVWSQNSWGVHWVCWDIQVEYHWFLKEFCFDMTIRHNCQCQVQKVHRVRHLSKLPSQTFTVVGHCFKLIIFDVGFFLWDLSLIF